MEHTSSSSLISILRTVLYLVDHNRDLTTDSAAVLDFKRATIGLMLELDGAAGPRTAEEKDAGGIHSVHSAPR
jgi:hypothetical protein